MQQTPKITSDLMQKLRQKSLNHCCENSRVQTVFTCAMFQLMNRYYKGGLVKPLTNKKHHKVITSICSQSYGRTMAFLLCSRLANAIQHSICFKNSLKGWINMDHLGTAKSSAQFKSTLGAGIRHLSSLFSTGQKLGTQKQDS